MRISITHLLLLGSVLAAPIQDVNRAVKVSEDDSLIARDLFHLFEHAIVPLKPKPVGHPSGPDAPAPPVRPGGPDTIPPNDGPEPLRPLDPDIPKPKPPTRPINGYLLKICAPPKEGHIPKN
ncbi:hypothetical protein K458DRAFT_393504 [Lentithecium fluviatile CBS 122367]|uniref:Uncharacterized protein n=1 Tax=Lentithecium fluviatile CBS 122367 TaxID=1168545 RepID=A0A6G1IPY8_9PLEO|nr:hypothetical protein K458DRAFT_393504 [Lentithecium fluviatile CBS 122367]